jgi:hypothetical protein
MWPLPHVDSDVLSTLVIGQAKIQNEVLTKHDCQRLHSFELTNP